MAPAGARSTISSGGRFPTSDPLPERLFPPLPTGVHWGLERTRAALAAVGDPHTRFASIHVGGTNGKGSVAATLAAVMGRSRKGREGRTGLYTSPHLVSFRERFRVAGAIVGDAELLESAAELRPVLEAHGLTFFEATTVLAFHVFGRLGVDLAVVEVGLGGRLDATNVVLPMVAGITNVALDHADHLGESLEEIAREKAGIVKPGVPLVTAEVGEVPRAILAESAREKGAPFRALDPDAELLEVTLSREGSEFGLETEAWGVLRLRTPLLGWHQAVNAGLAVRMLERLPEAWRPEAEAVVRGMGSVSWPGRLETRRVGGATVVLDVAHNTAGVEALSAALAALALPGPVVLLVGVLGDKDWAAMLRPLVAVSDRAILTQPPSAPPERRWDPRAALAAIDAPAGARVEPDFAEALARALEAAGEGTVLITGSHHTVGDAMQALGLEPRSD